MNTTLNNIPDDKEEQLLEKDKNIYITHSSHEIHNPVTPEKLEHLKSVQNLPFHRRIFRTMKNGSLRGCVITWIRITMGIGVFAVPFFMTKMGGLLGLITIFVAGIINYKSFIYIFEASEYTGINNFSSIVEKLLPKWILKIFQVTMFLELVSIMLLYTLASWNLFEFFAYYIGFFKEEWLVNKNTLKFDEYNLNVFLWRLAFFFIVFIISFRNLLKKTMESTRIISLFFVISLFTLLIYLLIQAPFFRSYYQEKNELIITPIAKKIDLCWIESFFAFLLTYNIQVNALDIKRELFHPTFKRVTKLVRISLSLEIIWGLLLATAGYFSLGDCYTPELLLLRKPIHPNGIMETFMRIFLAFFFIFLIAGLSTFNVSLKNFIMQMMNIKQITKRQYYFYSVFPFVAILLVSLALPYIIIAINIFGLTIYNVNAYLIPYLLKYEMHKRKGKKFSSILYLLGCIFLFVLSIVGTVYNLMHLEI